MVFSNYVDVDPPNFIVNQPQQQASTAANGSGAGSKRPSESSPTPEMAKAAKREEAALICPRCGSTNTKFCYYNNHSLSQPRHFCKTCRRYWTRGGALRNVPVGGGCRRNKRSKAASVSVPSGLIGSSMTPLFLGPAMNNLGTTALSFSGLPLPSLGAIGASFPLASGGGLASLEPNWRSAVQQQPWLLGTAGCCGGAVELPSLTMPPLVHLQLQGQLEEGAVAGANGAAEPQHTMKQLFEAEGNPTTNGGSGAWTITDTISQLVFNSSSHGRGAFE